ncbi:MAG: nucleotidyl transferase AbiEii/AbiGii toxin family protein [Patescibacteria group bacterium]
MDFHKEILPAGTLETFSKLSHSSLIGNFYLAGGTGLALQLGHRFSNDLDFFTPKKFNEETTLQEIISLGKLRLEKKEAQAIVCQLDETKLSFLGYGYPLLEPLKHFDGISVAEISDIACMKIDAIASRGTKRDFIDVYFVMKEIMPLNEILANFKKKYAKLNYNTVHIKKSLVYFNDAENDAMPRMIKPVYWEKVKETFESEVKKLGL